MEKNRKSSDIETVLILSEFNKVIKNFKKLSEALLLMQENSPNIIHAEISNKIKFFDSFELLGINLQKAISELPKINTIGNIPTSAGSGNYKYIPNYDVFNSGSKIIFIKPNDIIEFYR